MAIETAAVETAAIETAAIDSGRGDSGRGDSGHRDSSNRQRQSTVAAETVVIETVVIETEPRYGMTQQSYSEQSWRQPAEPWQGKAEPWQGKAEPRRGKAEPRRGKAEPRHGKDAFATEAEAVAKLVVLDRVRRAAIRMVVITAILGCCLVGIVVWAAVSGKLDRQIEFMAPVLFLLNLARFRKGLRTLRRMQRAKANLPAQPHRIEAPRSVGHVGEHRGGVSWG